MTRNAPGIRFPTRKANFSIVTVGYVEYAFSYQTCIGFREYTGAWVITENLWGPTTGKHLNLLADPSRRIPFEEFEERLADVAGTSEDVYDVARGPAS